MRARTPRDPPPDPNPSGRDAEERAARYLRRAGYRVLERNWRCRLGELDLVCRDGRLLVFVEVRSRAGARHGSGLEAISAGKLRQVARVAAVYLAAHPKAADSGCRFDVVGVTGDDIELIKDAYRPGLP